MIVFRPQRWTTARILPRHSCFLAGSTGGPCPQAPFGSSLQQTAIQDILLPLETLASSPSIWEVPDFPVLMKVGFITSRNPHVSLLAHYSQSRRDEQTKLPGGTGAGSAPGQVRSSAALELCCHPTCFCTPTPCNPPRWGLLPPEAVTQAPALPLPLIYCSPLPQTKPLLCRLLSESSWQVGRGQGEEGPWSRWNLSLGSNESSLRLSSPASLIQHPKADHWPASPATPSNSHSVPAGCEVLARAQ